MAKKKQYQTAEEWMNQNNTYSAGNRSSGGGYQTADEWLGENGSALKSSQDDVSKQLEKYREELRKRKLEQRGKDSILPNYGKNAFRSNDFGYNAFKNGLSRDNKLDNSAWYQTMQSLGSPEKTVAASIGALGGAGKESAGKSYTPKVNVGSAAETLKRLSNERAAGLMQAAGMGQTSQQNQQTNQVIGDREITDTFFQELLGDGADQQKQTYGAYLMRDAAFVGNLTGEQMGSLKKSAEKYAEELDKTRWMKSAQMAEMEEQGATPEELEAYQNELDKLTELGQLWKDGAQRLEWTANIAGRQEQVHKTEAEARSAADFEQVAAMGSSRGKNLSNGELQQYNLWLQYGKPDGVSFQDYWEGQSAWETGENRKVSNSRAQRKADEILMGMMDAERERAQQEYDASLLELERASNRLYDADYAEFDQAVTEYNAAMEGFKKAEKNLSSSKQAAQEVRKELSKGSLPAGQPLDILGREARKEAGPQEPNPLEFYLSYKDSDQAAEFMPEGIQTLMGYADQNSWGKASQEQRQVFAYLWETDRESAWDYLQQIQVELSREAMNEKLTQQAKDWEKKGFWGKTGENLMSTVNMVFGSAAAGLDELASMLSGDRNVYRGARWAQQEGAMTRQLTSDDLYRALGYDKESGEEPNFWQDMLVNGYNALGSALDSAVGVALLGMGYTATMGAGSAAQKAQELYERGASEADITMGALASGGLEAAFEYLSLDKIIKLQDGDGLKNFVINALKSSGVEASEELFTEIGNQVAESLLFGANSNTKDREDQYIAQGKSPEEAKRLAIRDAAMDSFWAAYGGFISGGAFSATGVPRLIANEARGVAGNIKQSIETRKTGERILQNEGGSELIETARKNGVPDKLIEIAVEKASGDFQDMSRWQQGKAKKAMGKLHEATVQAQTEKVAQELKESFKETAKDAISKAQEQQQTGEENRDTENQQTAKTPEEIDAAAETAAKAAIGEELTEQEQKTLNDLGGNKFIADIANSREFQENAMKRTEGLTQQMEDTAALVRDNTKQREVVRRFAQENGMDEAVMLSSMGRTQDGARFASAWESAYQMGAGGIDLRYAQKASANSYLTQQQIETAYNEGRKVYDEEIGEMDLSDGGQWNDRADPSRALRPVEAGTAAEGFDQQQGAGGGTAAAAEKISPIELGIPNGSSNKKVYRVLEEAYDADDKVAYQKARDNGLQFVAYRGGAIETFENMNGRKVLVKSRGLVANGTMYVRVDDNTFTASQIAGHEAAHEQIRRGEIDVEQVKQQLLDRYDQQELDAIIDLYAKAYGDSGLTAEEVLEEILCDAMGQMNAFATEATERIAGEVGVFLRNVRKNARKVATKKSAVPNTESGSIKHSIVETEDGRMVAVVDNDILANIDTRSWDKSKIEQAKSAARHALSQFSDGIIVNGITRKVNKVSKKEFTRSKYTQHLANTDTGIFADKMRMADIANEVVEVTSGWGRDGGLVHQRNDNFIDFDHGTALVMAGENKYKTEVVVGITNRGEYVFYDVTNISPVSYKIKEESHTNATTDKPIGAVNRDSSEEMVSQRDEKVKQKYSREIDSEGNHLTEAQAEFFKDSKIRDEDGNLRVVYHGTDAEFTVFDRTKARANMDIQGSFFSPWDMDAGGYGGNVKAYYLNIKKPAPEGVGYKALNRFKGQNRAGEKARAYLESLGYDGVNNGDEEYIAFYPEQIKLVSNQNPTSNEDIRYSREMDTQKALERQVELLKGRVEYWKEQTRTRKNIGKKADEAEVRKLGRKLLREYSSDTTLEEILPELQRLADQKDDYSVMEDIAQTVARRILEGSGVDVNGELAEDRKALKKYLWSTPINITEGIKAGIPDFSDWKKQNRGLRFREDGSGTDVDSMWLELQDEFGFGMFPEDIMNPEDQVRYIADQLNDMREDIQNPYAKDMEFSVQQAAMEILNGAMEINPEELTRADMAVEKATEEMRRLLDEGRARERNRIENAKKTDARQRIKTIAERFQRMATKPGKGASQHAPESLKKAVVDFCELFTDSELRRMDRWQKSLEYRADEVGRKMGTVMNQSLLNEYQTIESQQARKDRVTARLSDLRSEYAKLQNDGRFQTVYDETVAEMIETVEGMLKEKDLYQLDAYELRQVQNAVTGLYYTITNANKAFSMGKDKSISDMAQKMAREIQQTNPKQAGMGMLFRRFMQWQMSPDTYFNYLCGFIKNNEGRVIQDGFRRGSERMMGVKRDFYQLFREFTESKDPSIQKELRHMVNFNAKELVSWGLKDLEGNEVKTTRGMMLQAYMLLNQGDSFESLQHGGFTVPNMKRYYSGDRVGSYGDALETTIYSESPGQGFTELVYRNKDIQERMEQLQQKLELSETESYRQRYQQELNELEKEMLENRRKMEAISNQAAEKLLNMTKAIEEQLTPLEKELIGKAHEWYSYSGKLMSDVFLQMYGFKPKLVESYVPIHRDTTTIKTDIRNMAEAEKALNLENSGFTIERVKNSQRILLTDFFDELNRQSDKMGRYVGFAQVQKDFGKIWKTRVDSRGMTVNTLVRARFGAGKTAFGVSGEEYINHYIADVAGGHSSDDILGSFYGNYAAATLRFNGRVAISQVASIPTAASVVGWKSIAAGFAKGLPKSLSKKYRNELVAKNEWFYQRYRGHAGITELADISKKGGIFETFANTKFGKFMFNWCQNFDVFATGSIMWNAAEDYVLSKGIGKGTAEYEAAVNQVYTDIIRKSQPNYTVTERSDFLRDNRAHMKILTMFKTQSNQNFNLLLEANGEFNRMKRDFKNGLNGVTEADVKQAGEKLYNAATGVLVGQIVFVLLRTMFNFAFRAVKPYRDKETDEVTWEATLTAMGKEFLSAMFGTVALGGQLYDVIESVWDRENFYGLNDSAISSISGILENSVQILINWRDEEKSVSLNQIWKETNGIFTRYGIPVGNAKKFVYDTIKSYYTDIKKGDIWAFTSEDTTKNQYRARIEKYYLNGEEEKAAEAMGILIGMSAEDTDEEVRKDVAEGMRGYLREKYKKGKISAEDAIKLMDFTGSDDPEGTVKKWDFQLEHPEYDNPGDSLVAAYYKKGDISDDVFFKAWKFKGSAEGDKDKDGKTISGSKKQKVVDYIQKIPGLSFAQKKQLFELLNVGSIKGTPWE